MREGGRGRSPCCLEHNHQKNFFSFFLVCICVWNCEPKNRMMNFICSSQALPEWSIIPHNPLPASLGIFLANVLECNIILQLSQRFHLSIYSYICISAYRYIHIYPWTLARRRQKGILQFLKEKWQLVFPFVRRSTSPGEVNLLSVWKQGNQCLVGCPMQWPSAEGEAGTSHLLDALGCGGRGARPRRIPRPSCRGHITVVFARGSQSW